MNTKQIKINPKLSVFVVEDNQLYSKLICESLKRAGVTKIRLFDKGADCIEAIKAGEKPNAIVQDYHLGDMNGIDVLQEVKAQLPRVQFVFLTANEDMEVAVNSIKYGAFDYITKDHDMALKKLVHKVEKISEVYELYLRNKLAKQVIGVILVVLISIVILAMLHTFFDAFGLR